MSGPYRAAIFATLQKTHERSRHGQTRICIRPYGGAEPAAAGGGGGRTRSGAAAGRAGQRQDHGVDYPAGIHDTGLRHPTAVDFDNDLHRGRHAGNACPLRRAIWGCAGRAAGIPHDKRRGSAHYRAVQPYVQPNAARPDPKRERHRTAADTPLAGDEPRISHREHAEGPAHSHHLH